jgi:hypothetical protein
MALVMVVQLQVLVAMDLVTAVWLLLAAITSMVPHLVRMRCEVVPLLTEWFSA